jgi:hypothetical protein
MHIGNDCIRYPIAQGIVNKFPTLVEQISCYGSIDLPKVDEDVGHTFVHFLYTRCYQTLPLPSATTSEAARLTEYKRAVLTYCAARTYRISELVDLAKEKIESFDASDISIFQMQDIAETVAERLASDETWFPEYVKNRVKQAFRVDDSLFTQDRRILESIGQVRVFDKAVLESIAELYAEQVTLNKTLRENSSRQVHHSTFQFPTVPSFAFPELPVESDSDTEAVTIPVAEHAAPAESSADDNLVIDGPTIIRIPKLADLEGHKIEKSGKVLDDNSRAIGRLVEGNPRDLAVTKAICDAEGNVLQWGIKAGKVEVVLPEEPIEVPSPQSPPIEDLLASAEPPPLSILKGRTIEEDGTILNDNGVAIGEVIEGDASRFNRISAKCDSKGNIVNSKRKTLGRAQTLVPQLIQEIALPLVEGELMEKSKYYEPEEPQSATVCELPSPTPEPEYDIVDDSASSKSDSILI